MSHSIGSRQLQRITLTTLTILILVFALWLWWQNLTTPPSAELWPKWLQHDSKNPQTIDHSPWKQFLSTYLDSLHPSGVARMNYKAVSKKDQEKLSDYLEMLQKVPISSYNQQEQKAYWINLYNALTVRLILEHYPIKSILDIRISPGFLTFGP